MQTKQHLSTIHQSILDWNSSVKLASDELVGYRKHLAEISLQNTAHEVKSKVEHFQNQFLLQETTIETLLQDLQNSDAYLAAKAKGNPASDHILLAPPADLKVRIDTFSKLFSELKTDFFRFLAVHF